MRGSLARLAVVVGFISFGGQALAQPASVDEKKKQARELYDSGSAQYDLGRYQEAIALFTKSYETFPSPVLLFNIAQSHRQLGNCKDATFFYNRYLLKKPDAPNRAEVEGWLKEMKTACAQATATPPPPAAPAPAPTVATTSPTTTSPPQPTAAPAPVLDPAPTAIEPAPVGGSDTSTPATSTAGDVAVSGGSAAASSDGAALRFAAGPSFPSFGELESAAGMGFALGGGYPLTAGGMPIDVGALLTYTPVPWESSDGEVTGTAGLTALLANAGLERAFGSLRGRAELGLGFLVMTGVAQEGNPFIAEDQMATGALSFFHARFAIGVDYALGPKLSITAQPLVVSWSPAAKLREEVGAIGRYEALVGVGYRL